MPRTLAFSLLIARIRRRLFRNYKTARLLVGVPIFIVVILAVFIFLAPVIRISKDIFFGPVGVFSIVVPSQDEIKSTSGRTNILLLGTGGAGHEGPNLSDTMIVVSAKTKLGEEDKKSQPTIILISIPRDIYLDSLDEKINTAYATGAEKGGEAGLILAKGAVSQITGLPIHYGVRGDFSAFEKLVDIVDGIDVSVEKVLDDPEYPISGKENDTCNLQASEIESPLASSSPEEVFKCRYEHLHFDPGVIHMDGATALKFVRSRHATNDEGTDFARSRRQQLVISALKSKIFSTDTLFHLNRLEEIYELLKAHIDTDLKPSQAKTLFNLALKYRESKFRNVILGEELLDNPPIDERGWVLVPKGGNWDQVHEYIKTQI